MTKRLGDGEIRQLGYEPRRDGWRLADANRRPGPHPSLCKACEKFTGHPDWDELCAGCLWYGPGDPHGLSRSEIRAVVRGWFRKREAG